MLIDFHVENHRSICSEQILTLEAGRVGDVSDGRPRTVIGHSERLLPVAALYGSNASGKTNVLSGLSFMRDAVTHSFSTWEPDQGIPRTPFAWGPCRTDPSLFEVTILVSGVRYEYGFCVSDDTVLEEWLFAWPNGKKQIWFERENGEFKFGDKLLGDNRLIEGVTRANALFLSTAVQFKHEQLQIIHSWFRRMRTLNLGESFPSFVAEREIARLFQTEVQASLFDEEESGQSNTADRFRSLLRNADLGIVDLKVEKVEVPERRMPRTRFQFKHDVAVEDSWLSLSQESKGTQTLFRSALPILETIRFGGVLVVDELEGSLHPSLARHIVAQFNDPTTNPNGGQLVFTTHDTNLLGTTIGEPVLRRDQVWLTEKDKHGVTVLYPLTEYQPRKAENLERGYIQGRYGAIPFLGDLTFIME
jgi:AAA15 family ATPase/GTPase